MDARAVVGNLVWGPQMLTPGGRMEGVVEAELAREGVLGVVRQARAAPPRPCVVRAWHGSREGERERER